MIAAYKSNLQKKLFLYISRSFNSNVLLMVSSVWIESSLLSHVGKLKLCFAVHTLPQ